MSEIVNEAGSQEKEAKYLVFAVAGTYYAISISHIYDIIQYQRMTAVPGLPDYLPGIFNLRGTIIPAMDVRLRFNQAPGEYNEKTIFVVINLSGDDIGLIVDSVMEVANFPDTELITPPHSPGEAGNQYVRAIVKKNGQSVLILDCAKLVASALPDSANEDAVFH